MGKRQAITDIKKNRIIDAARALVLSDSALAGFNIDAIARQAGVARMTIYNQFGGKAGLLEALFDDLARRGEMFRLPQVFQIEDPLRVLAEFIRAFGRFWTEDRLIIRRLHAMVALDAEMAAADAARQERRRTGARVIVERVRQKYSLHTNRRPDELAEILFAITSFEFFDAVAGDSRTPKKIVPLIQKLALKLFAPSSKTESHQ